MNGMDEMVNNFDDKSLPDVSEEDGMRMIVDAWESILQGMSWALGLDLSDPNLKGTPERVARAYKEMFSGLRDTSKQVKEILSAKFKCDYGEMVICKGVDTFSMCPHHFLPVHYRICVAYIPDGYVLGVSKLARLVVILAKRPVLQEQLTSDIVEALERVKPLGAAAYVEGEHSCMQIRGAKQRGKIITSKLSGAFLSNPKTRHEFYSIIGFGGYHAQ